MAYNYLDLLVELYEKAKVPVQAIPMEKYMKNKFPHLGIKSPERKEIYKKFFRQNGLPDKDDLEYLMKKLWEMPEREYQYFANALMDKMMKKCGPEIIGLLEYLIITKSWWDTVDWIAVNHVGVLFRNYQDMISNTSGKWMKSGNIWLQRSCILFQLKYRKETDFELLKNFILELAGSKEFFIQKAIGWALREYSKTNPDAVVSLIKNNQLAPLSVREGLKRIKN